MRHETDREPGGDRPLRVFHLIKSLGRGGAETLLLEGQRLDHPQIEYAYGYFLPWKDAMAEPLSRAGGTVVCFPASGPAGMLMRLPRVARELRRWRADLVHCHLPWAGIVGRLAARWVGVPVVYTEHNLLERYHPWTRKAHLLTWRLQTRVLTVSDEVGASVRRHAGETVPVEVLPNGVPVDRLVRDPEAGAKARERWGIPRGAPVVAQVAVFREQKRLDLWLEAARRIADRRPGVRFVLVGDGPLREEVERRRRELGLEELVTLTGLLEDVRSVLSAASVLMISSDFEGLPLVLLEGMAMELPIVSTSVGGIPQVVREGTTGNLVEPGDVAALAERVLALLEDPGKAERFGRAARAVVEAGYSTRRMMHDLERVYRRVHGREER